MRLLPSINWNAYLRRCLDLPNSNAFDVLANRVSHFPRHAGLALIALMIALMLLSGFQDFRSSNSAWVNTRLSHRPNFSKLRDVERNLSQSNIDSPFPEGHHGRYIKFSNQVKGMGWNNVLNDVLVCAHLAYLSQRAYVFQDYFWEPKHYPWPVPPWSSPQTPLSALVDGPLVGGPWGAGDSTPRSISATWWDAVCPPEDVQVISSSEVKAPVRDADGADLLAHWVEVLRNVPARCIDVVPGAADAQPETFDLGILGSARSISLGRALLESPTSRLLAASPLVLSALDRNTHLFLPRGPGDLHLAPRDSYARMMAVHVRRGDFRSACTSRALWASTFYQWNLWPTMLDVFVVPAGAGGGHASAEASRAYREHCYPSDHTLVGKIADARARFEEAGDRTLDVIYVLTNGDWSWVQRLKAQLAADGWLNIITSRDLELDDEQREVAMAVDMEIARRAAVFIGNGWSSLTSNVMHRRLVDQREPLANRLW